MLYRHGDVMIQAIDELPPDAKAVRHRTLAFGEITGHSHQIKESEQVALWQSPTQLYVQVKRPFATVVHEEHASIELPRGIYRVWQQREYTPERIVTVRD